MLVISCHADTNFPFHNLSRHDEGLVQGHLDNFAGVYAVMQAFFSGRLNQDDVRIELTYGEEIDFAGALEVRESVEPDDVVIVVDVTGTPTHEDFVIEKCDNPNMQQFLVAALSGLSFDLYDDCPDPIADMDESDVYSEKCPMTCMLGIPCFGGDYNEAEVFCKSESLDQTAEALCRIAEYYSHLISTAAESDRRAVLV